MTDEARARAAAQLIQAAETRLQRARQHLYECDKEAMAKLVHCSVDLEVVLAKLRMEYKPEQLKPCPFCGSDKKLHTMALGEKEGEEIHILSCCKCDFQIKKTSEKDLFETWNKRRSDE